MSASGVPTPMTVVYSELVDVNLNPNNINLVDVDYGHRIQVEIPAVFLNDTFRWSRASGDRVPSAYIDAIGLSFVLNEIQKYVATYGFWDLDAANKLNYNNTDLNAKVRTMTTNDLVVAYILYKLYNDSTYDLSGTTYNPEDLKNMLTNQTFLEAINTSLTGASQQALNSMLNELLVSDPMRFFDAAGNQIPGLFEVVDGVAGQGNFMIAQGDIIEIRIRLTFQSLIQRTSLDSGNGDDKIISGDKFMVRLQLVATNNPPILDSGLSKLVTTADINEAQTIVTSYVANNMYLGTAVLLTTVLAAGNQNGDPVIREAINQQLRTEIIANSTDITPNGTNAYTLTISTEGGKSTLVNALTASDPSYDSSKSIKVIIPDYSSGAPSVPVSTTDYNYIMLADGETITLTNGGDSIEATYSSADPAYLTVDGVNYLLGDSIPIGASFMKVLGFSNVMISNPVGPPPPPPSGGASKYIASGYPRDLTSSSKVIQYTTDLSNWNTMTAPTNILNMRSIATNGSNVYLAVEQYTGNALVSSDGSNWNSIIVDSYPQYVVNVNGIFYPIQGSPSQFSTNGSNWLNFASGDVNVIQAIGYGNGIYLAGVYDSSYNSYLYKSTDGSNWTSLSACSMLYSIAYNNGVWVRCSGDGTSYSTDNGSNWSSVNLAGSFIGFNLAYGNGTWVGCGSYNSSNYVSSDGSNWTATSAFASTYPGADYVIFDGTKFIGIANPMNVDRTHMIQTSTDGSNWTETSDITGFTRIFDITFVGNSGLYFAAGSDSSSAVQMSTDLINWNSPTLSATIASSPNGNYVVSLANNGSNLIIGANNSVSLFTSTDGGSNWFAVLPGTSFNSTYSGVKYVNGKFYAFGTNTDYVSNMCIISSTDGSNWSTTGPTDSGLYMIETFEYGNGLYVVTGWKWNGSDWIFPCWTSTDGSNWTLNTNYDLVTPASCIRYANGVWMLCGYDSVIYKSTDGINWTSTNGLGSWIAFGNGVWVTAYNDTYYTYSTDNGDTWNDGYYLTDSWMETIVFDGSIFIAGGTANDPTMYTQISTDGINWTATGDVKLNEVITLTFIP